MQSSRACHCFIQRQSQQQKCRHDTGHVSAILSPAMSNLAHLLKKSWCTCVAMCLASRSFAWPSRFAAGSYILSIISERKWVSGTVSYCGCSTMHFCLDKTAAALLIIMDAAVWKRAAVELAWPNGVSSILHYHRVCCCLPCCVINSCVYH